MLVSLADAPPRSSLPDSAGVCEVLANLSKFSNQLVTVRARLAADVDIWLTQDDCAPVIKVNGVEFQNLIAIVWPDDPIIKGFDLFPLHRSSSKLLTEVLREVDREKEQVFVEVVGLLMTRDPPLYLVHEKTGSRIGFGHLGIAPAQIVVKEIKGLTKRPRGVTVTGNVTPKVARALQSN